MKTKRSKNRKPVMNMDRREFLTTTAVVAGGLVLGFHLPPIKGAKAAVQAQPWYNEPTIPELNAWIAIAPDDTVTIRIGQTEIGTGVLTSCAMIVAEELQCDWNKVRVEHASANRDVREQAPEWTLAAKGIGTGPQNPLGDGDPVQLRGQNGVYRRMSINSSGSVREGRFYLQLAGAEGRERLLLAAATQLGVPARELVAKNSVITHTASGRSVRYGQVAARAAAVQLPDPSAITVKHPDQFTLLGTSQKNFDVPLKTTGQATYGIDVRVPNMVYAASKSCPVYGGKVKSYDFNAIRNMPGVHSVVQFEPGRGFPSGGMAVVADTWWHAKTALDVMPIEWDQGQHAMANSEQMFRNLMDSFKDPGRPLPGPITDARPSGATVWINHGNVDEGFAKAAKIVEATYTVPYVKHFRSEPGNATVRIGPDRVDVWAGPQSPQSTLSTAAEVTGMSPDKVFVHTAFLGGGYGGGGDQATRQAVTIAKTLNGRPVKLLWTREEEQIIGDSCRPMGIGVLKAGLDANGWPIAIHVRSAGDYYGGQQQERGLTQWPYYVDNYRYDSRTLNTHVPVGYRRATGTSVNDWYVESFIDELAHAAGKDPYRYRRELIARNPDEGIGGFKYRDYWLKALDMAAEMSGWGTPLPRGTARSIVIGDRRRSTRKTVTICAEVHTVEVTRRGQVHDLEVHIAFETGFSLMNELNVRKQIEGQMAWGISDALWSQATYKNGQLVERNFDTYPIAKMKDNPKTHIAFFKTNKWIEGVGEEAIPQVAPAIANAVFMITGKRIRSLPLTNHDLSWA